MYQINLLEKKPPALSSGWLIKHQIQSKSKSIEKSIYLTKCYIRMIAPFPFTNKSSQEELKLLKF
jgi:hypothetical protein